MLHMQLFNEAFSPLIYHFEVLELIVFEVQSYQFKLHQIHFLMLEFTLQSVDNLKLVVIMKHDSNLQMLHDQELLYISSKNE